MGLGWLILLFISFGKTIGNRIKKLIIMLEKRIDKRWALQQIVKLKSRINNYSFWGLSIYSNKFFAIYAITQAVLQAFTKRRSLRDLFY